MAELVIRQAVPGDGEELSHLIRESMESYRRDSGITRGVLESLNESVESVEDRIKRHRCLCLIDREKIVGTITISVCDNPMKYSFSPKTSILLSEYDRCGYISRFAVADDLRKTGLGLKLMNEALGFCAHMELDLVLLHTAVANRRMKDFYSSSGFLLVDSENSRGYERGLFAYYGEAAFEMAVTA